MSWYGSLRPVSVKWVSRKVRRVLWADIGMVGMREDGAIQMARLNTAQGCDCEAQPRPDWKGRVTRSPRIR